MGKIRTVIIDDDPHGIEVLHHHLKKTSRVEVVGMFTSPIKALDAMEKISVDLVFLDISMEGLQGFEVARLLDPKIIVVFCTGHREYALEGYATDAVDYLVKPVSFPRMLQALNKVEERLKFIQKERFVPQADSEFILVYKGGRNHNFKILLKDIVYIEARRNGSAVYFSKNDFIEIGYSVANLYKQLPKKRFLRIHKSCIIALDKYLCFEKGFIRLQGGHNKPLSLGKEYEDSFYKWVDAHSLKR